MIEGGRKVNAQWLISLACNTPPGLITIAYFIHPHPLGPCQTWKSIEVSQLKGHSNPLHAPFEGAGSEEPEGFRRMLEQGNECKYFFSQRMTWDFELTLDWTRMFHLPNTCSLDSSILSSLPFPGILWWVELGAKQLNKERTPGKESRR